MHTVMLRLTVKVALKSGHFVARDAQYPIESFDVQHFFNSISNSWQKITSRRCWKLIDINCKMSKETQMSMQMLLVYWIVLVKCYRCSHNLCWLQKLCPNLHASSNHRRCDCCFPQWQHRILPLLLFWLLVVVVCCCSECSCDWKCERLIFHLYLKQSSEFLLWWVADIRLINILVKTRLD